MLIHVQKMLDSLWTRFFTRRSTQSKKPERLFFGVVLRDVTGAREVLGAVQLGDVGRPVSWMMFSIMDAALTLEKAFSDEGRL